MSVAADLNAARKRLEDIDRALSDAAQGQSVSMAGANLTRQGLEDLRRERSRLAREIRDLEILEAGGTLTLGATVRFPTPGSV